MIFRQRVSHSSKTSGLKSSSDALPSRLASCRNSIRSRIFLIEKPGTVSSSNRIVCRRISPRTWTSSTMAGASSFDVQSSSRPAHLSNNSSCLSKAFTLATRISSEVMRAITDSLSRWCLGSSWPTRGNPSTAGIARNPFIPSRSTVCRLADWLLIFGLVIAGLIAAIAALISQVLA